MLDQATASRIEHVNTYDEYQRQEGLPVVRGFAVDDLKTVEVAPWARTGGRGAFVNLEGTGGSNDAYVLEIPPGASLHPQRHMYEEMLYVVEGSGSTTVWYDEERKSSFEWQAGSLFSIPLNAWYRHYNGQGARAARLLAVTSAPLMMNLFHDQRFIFENPFVFSGRFGGEADYFTRDGDLRKVQTERAFVLDTNFVPNTHTLELYTFPGRGAGGKSIFLELTHNTMCGHISEFPVGTYKKAHRHGPGAHVIILSGTGYSLLWPQGAEPRRVDWHAGSVVVPPSQWFHQHFNTGTEPARYLALRWGSQRYDLDVFREGDSGGTDVSVKEGGWQIEYTDEDPAIHQEFEADLARSGVACRMRSLVASCTGPQALAQAAS